MASVLVSIFANWNRYLGRHQFGFIVSDRLGSRLHWWWLMTEEEEASKPSSTTISVTGWLDYFVIFGHFTALKICPKACQICQSVFKLLQYTKLDLKIIAKYFQSFAKSWNFAKWGYTVDDDENPEFVAKPKTNEKYENALLDARGFSCEPEFHFSVFQNRFIFRFHPLACIGR